MKIGACRGKLGVEGVRVYIETGEESTVEGEWGYSERGEGEGSIQSGRGEYTETGKGSTKRNTEGERGRGGVQK